MSFAAIPFYSLGGMDEPLERAMLSSAIGNEKQGALQGAFASVVSLSRIVSPLIVTKSFSYFTSAPFAFPAAPFVINALIMVFAYFLVRRAFQDKKTQ